MPPTASHVFSAGQEMPLATTPSTMLCCSQVKPPSVVRNACPVAGPPKKGALRAISHVVEDAQLIAAGDCLVGMCCDPHVAPPLLVPMTTPTGLKPEVQPKASHFVGRGQAIPERSYATLGTFCNTQAAPPLVVRRAPLSPTASHTLTVGQEIASTVAPGGNFWTNQVWPALVVRRTAPDDLANPAASHVVAEGQARPEIPVIPAGKACRCQCSPPSAVPKTMPSVPVLLAPAASQAIAVGHTTSVSCDAA